MRYIAQLISRARIETGNKMTLTQELTKLRDILTLFELPNEVYDTVDRLIIKENKRLEIISDELRKLVSTNYGLAI
jgi:hypothetical protein